MQDRQSRGRWFFSIDALAWLASEEVSSIWADVVTVQNNTSSWKALSFDFDWDYRFRVGAGHSFFYCDWDIAFYWTKFSTDAKHTIEHNPNAKITPEFFAAFLSGNVPFSMSVKWDLDLNMFDWELGKRYSVSNCLCLRPFIGLKGGWIKQSIHGKYDNLTIDNILYQS